MSNIPEEYILVGDEVLVVQASVGFYSKMKVVPEFFNSFPEIEEHMTNEVKRYVFQYINGLSQEELWDTIKVTKYIEKRDN